MLKIFRQRRSEGPASLEPRPARKNGAVGKERQAAADKKATEKVVRAKLGRLENAVWVEKVRDPRDSGLSIFVRSRTEWARAAKVKETWTCEWIYSLPKGSVLWDVGANVGIMTLIAAACDNVEAVVAIEPFSANYDAIVQNARMNGLSDKIIAIAGGLSDSTGFFPLNLENVTPGGALHSFGNIAKIGEKRKGECVGRQMCAAYRMDDLVELEGIPFPTHIKVDVDGFEERLLDGASRVLQDRRVKGAQIETMDPTAAEARKKNAVTKLMTGFGFRLARECVHSSSKLHAVDLQFVRPGD